MLGEEVRLRGGGGIGVEGEFLGFESGGPEEGGEV